MSPHIYKGIARMKLKKNQYKRHIIVENKRQIPIPRKFLYIHAFAFFGKYVFQIE